MGQDNEDNIETVEHPFWHSVLSGFVVVWLVSSELD